MCLIYKRLEKKKTVHMDKLNYSNIFFEEVEAYRNCLKNIN